MKIAVLEPLGIVQQQLEASVREAVGESNEVVFFPDRQMEPQELIRRIGDAEAAVFSNIPFPREVVEGCPNLKYLCVAFTGCDHVDLDACRARGIQVANASGYSTVAVAELVFALALSLMRQLLVCDARTRSGEARGSLLGCELRGKTFGVVGLGAIGQRVAALAQAFDCQVLAYSRSPKAIPGVLEVPLEELLRRSDLVSLHLPLGPETKGLINQERLALMKPGALLINTARGPIVDAWALAEALNEERLGGAAIDVFEGEPPLPKDHPLLTAKNTQLAPHVAYATHESMERRATIVCENLRSYLAGSPQNLVLN